MMEEENSIAVYILALIAFVGLSVLLAGIFGYWFKF